MKDVCERLLHNLQAEPGNGVDMLGNDLSKLRVYNVPGRFKKPMVRRSTQTPARAHAGTKKIAKANACMNPAS